MATEYSSLPRGPACLADSTSRDARPPVETDAELVRQMQTDSEAAFATFYDRFAPVLFSMICSILRDEKESEGVLQEAFLQMRKRVATYNAQRSSLFTWAVMISRHKAIDRLRARRGQLPLTKAVTSEASDVSIPASTDLGDELLARSDESDRVRAALSRVANAQREAIDLAFFGDLTQAQIAEKMGAPLGIVKARIRRGLLTLRDLLEEGS